jgi:hypothetical protein
MPSIWPCGGFGWLGMPALPVCRSSTKRRPCSGDALLEGEGGSLPLTCSPGGPANEARRPAFRLACLEADHSVYSRLTISCFSGSPVDWSRLAETPIMRMDQPRLRQIVGGSFIVSFARVQEKWPQPTCRLQPPQDAGGSKLANREPQLPPSRLPAFAVNTKHQGRDKRRPARLDFTTQVRTLAKPECVIQGLNNMRAGVYGKANEVANNIYAPIYST